MLRGIQAKSGPVLRLGHLTQINAPIPVRGMVARRGTAGMLLMGERKQRRWPALVGLMALALIVLPFSPSEARSVFSACGIRCVIADEMPLAPSLSSGVTQLPCEGHHCAHGPFFCMSGCLACAGLAVPAESLTLAPFLDVAVYPMVPPTRPNGFGVRPALPPPRAIV